MDIVRAIPTVLRRRRRRHSSFMGVVAMGTSTVCALLVGIDDYQAPSPQLSGCINDIVVLGSCHSGHRTRVASELTVRPSAGAPTLRALAHGRPRPRLMTVAVGYASIWEPTSIRSRSEVASTS
jgi:hypothetical protein